MSTVNTPDELLEPKEAASFLKISVSWLAKARMRNDGPPFFQVGRNIRYGKAALTNLQHGYSGRLGPCLDFLPRARPPSSA